MNSLRWKMVMAVVAAAAAGAMVWRQAYHSPSPSRAVNAAPAQVSSHYTGSSNCRECHEGFYQKWATSFHGLAMQPFTPELGRTQLTPQSIDIGIGKARYRVEMDAQGARVVERGPQGTKKHPIVQVMGGKNVFYFLTPLDRGRLQTLPLAYDVRRKEWYDTAASAVRHFADMTDQALDWRERPYTFNTSCYSCHVSLLSKNYSLTNDTYHTVWAEPGVSCETCHGPAEAHVKAFQNRAQGQPLPALQLISTKKFTPDQMNSLCAPCHAKMAPLTAAFKPGGRYFDHFDLAALENADFYPDARDLGENYTYTLWLTSPCVKSGPLDCLHCHTSSGRFRFAGGDANNSCLPCHQTKVDQVAAHSHHLPNSAGSQCIACHMPMTEFARMRRSDHSMRPPTPAATLAFQSPNACNLCHTNQDAAWADGWVRKWHDRDYQAPVIQRARLIDAARKRDWSKLPDILDYLKRADHDAVYAASLARLLRGGEDETIWPVMIGLLGDASPLVRSSAAGTLAAHPSLEALGPLAKAARDEYRVVRVQAALALAGVPREMFNAEDRRALEQAAGEFQALVQARPDDGGLHHNQGNFYLERREYERAIECFKTAQKLQPDNLEPLVNASIAYSALGQNENAEASLRQALKIQPTNAAALFNLGLLMGELGKTAEAKTALRQALQHDPQMAAAAFNLSVLLAGENLAEAIQWCRKAVNLRAREPKYAYTLAFYLRQSGDTAAAIQLLRNAIEKRFADAGIYTLLGQIFEDQKKLDLARDVYQKALTDERLPEDERQKFAAKLRL